MTTRFDHALGVLPETLDETSEYSGSEYMRAKETAARIDAVDAAERMTVKALRVIALAKSLGFTDITHAEIVASAFMYLPDHAIETIEKAVARKNSDIVEGAHAA